MSDESNETAQGQEMIVVDLNKRQTKKRIKQLRKGRGKLLGQIGDVISELQEAGTIGADNTNSLTLVNANRYVI